MQGKEELTAVSLCQWVYHAKPDIAGISFHQLFSTALSMGCPCNVAGDEPAQPGCTDNFQVMAFTVYGTDFAGAGDGVAEWQSVEQAFQACKFSDDAVREQIRKLRPDDGEDDRSFGIRCADFAGQLKDSSVYPHWDDVKAEVMYRLTRSKFACHGELRDELIATGTKEIMHSGGGYWGEWNAKVMLRLREELRPPKWRNRALLDSLIAKFGKEMTGSAADAVPGQEIGLPFPMPFCNAGVDGPRMRE
jgi:predicted NAD-dependent protein-ADP-ribosyltransferase YbiA (DUF1768 family)